MVGRRSGVGCVVVAVVDGWLSGWVVAVRGRVGWIVVGVVGRRVGWVVVGVGRGRLVVVGWVGGRWLVVVGRWWWVLRV